MLSNKEIVCPENLLSVAKNKLNVTAGIVNAGKRLPMNSAMEAVKQNLITPIFIGEKNEIQKCAEQLKWDISKYEIINEEEKEEIKEEKSDSETPEKSAVQTKKLAKQKKIRQKKAIAKNLDRIMDKVDKDIKDIAKNLAIKNIIKMQAMTSEQASLNMYRNAVFYKPKDIYLDQLNIFDFRQIYPNTNLATYVNNDKIEIKARKLNEIKIKKQRLLYELEMIKNG